ncbi:MAG: hypothetical protein EAZ85_04780 [Bacteroidetes bacterium]|nr:MAG: hypothetical protein EAZ85_04780 [Bacteroidota bacterium]TAG88248.1 MAG: hypothetical protein EAZ20_08930 [Bacteroidota bacterium]
METTLYETNYLKIIHNSEHNFLFISWIGFTSSQEFRDGINHIFDLMNQHQIKKTITDITEHKVISTEDQEYAAKLSIDFSRNFWDVKRALIPPKDVFARFSIKQVNAQVAKQEAQERRFFINYEEAFEWIIE